jgi:hypothetical protein
MSDIEIARRAIKKPMKEVAGRLGIPEDALEPYGRDKAKLDGDYVKALTGRKPGHLILVTAINPTKAGEGKTTTTIGLGDALSRLGKKTAIALREPARRRSCPWPTSTCISPVTSTPSRRRTTCWPRCSTITSIGAMRWGSMPAACSGRACST